MSNWPDGTVQTQSGCTIPAGAPLCGDCGNGFRFPPGQARTQQAGLTDFCGAAAPQHRRGAPVSRVWGRHSPTSSRPGGQMSGAKFGPQVDTCSHVTGSTDKLESVSNLYMNMFFDRLTTYQIQTPQSWYSKSRSYLQLPWSQSFQSAAEASFPLSLIFHSLSRQIHHRDWGWFLKLLCIVS